MSLQTFAEVLTSSHPRTAVYKQTAVLSESNLTWSMTSRDTERWRWWPRYVWSPFENGWRFRLAYNAAVWNSKIVGKMRYYNGDFSSKRLLYQGSPAVFVVEVLSVTDSATNSFHCSLFSTKSTSLILSSCCFHKLQYTGTFEVYFNTLHDSLPYVTTDKRQCWAVSFLALDSMLSALYAIARPSVRPSVCPSVRLSHGWISQKRLKLGSCNFHHTVAASLYFLQDKFHLEIRMGSPRAGASNMVGWGK